MSVCKYMYYVVIVVCKFFGVNYLEVSYTLNGHSNTK